MTNGLAVLLRVADREGEARAFQFAFIAHLATGLRIERGLVEDHYRFLTRADAIHRFAIDEQRSHFAVQLQMIVTFKFRGAVNADHRVIVSAETAGLARATALLFHGGLKAGFVNLDVALAADVRGQVDREAVGVVQTEGGFAIQGVAFQLRQLFIQQRQSALQSTGELLFFGFQHLLNLSLLLLQFFAGGAHHGDQRGNQFPEEGILRAQHVAVTDRAANDATQHVAAVFIRRDYAVSDQEGAGANVVGNNAQRLVRQIGGAGDFRHAGDQIAEQVDVIV